MDADLLGWLTSLGMTVTEHVAVDGQTLRAVAAGAVPGCHVVSVFAPQVRAVLSQVLVAGKGQEPAGMATLQQEWRRVCVWTDPCWPQTLGLTSTHGACWTMVRQIVRGERRRQRVRGHHVIQEEHVVRYFIVNHPLPAATVARYIRNHWGIENLLHRQRDMLLDQDRSTIRSGAAPTVWASMRNLLLTLLARAPVSNHAALRRTLAGRPQLAVSLLLAV